MKRSHLHYINKYIAVIVIGLFSAMPVFADGCSIGPVPLEIAIGTVSSVTSLGSYLSLVYEFIIGMTAIAAVAMIAFNGFGWALAAGNSEKVNDAKKKIYNALFGLVLALLSYSILFIINSELVTFDDICPPDIQVENKGDFSTSAWTECPSGQASECNPVDYCVGSCTCGVVYSGDTKTYCVPTGNETNGEGLACYRDSNCITPLTCLGGANNIKTIGFCTAATPGEACETEADCDANFVCEGRTATTKTCLARTGRENTAYCTSDDQCVSGFCNEASGQNVCLQGDGSTFLRCSGDDSNCDSAHGYYCGANKCEPRVEGTACNSSDEPCSTGFYCDLSGLNRCYDGSEGDPCDTSGQCELSGNYCDYTGGNNCYDGSPGDPCDEVSQCKTATGTRTCSGTPDKCGDCPTGTNWDATAKQCQ